MASYFKVIVGFGLSAFVMGCDLPEMRDGYQYKPDTTLSEKDADVYECRLKSIREVPVNNQMYSSPGYTTPVSCSSSYGVTTCTGGDTIGGGLRTVDVNSDLRDHAHDRCMAAKGYKTTPFPIVECLDRWVPEGFVHENTKISTPVKGSCWTQGTDNAIVIVLPDELA